MGGSINVDDEWESVWEYAMAHTHEEMDTNIDERETRLYVLTYVCMNIDIKVK